MMLTFYKRYARTIFDIALIVVTVYLIMWIFSLLYSIAKPIFIGLLIFIVIEPMANFFHKRGMKKTIATTLSTLLFVLVIVGAIVTAGFIFTSEIIQLAKVIPDYAEYVQQQLYQQSESLKDRLASLPPQFIDKIQEYAGTIISKLSGLLSNFFLSLGGALTTLTTIVSVFTSFIFNFVIGIILAYFLSIEIDTWRRVAQEHTPNTFKQAYFFLKENVIKGIVSYIKAQSILISISFIIILTGLLILGIGNAFSIALLAAFFDVLPVLGVSAIFIPWIIYLLIVSETTLAIWLLVLFGIVVIVRQLLEPKITADSLGVSAFTMLSFMIISLSLFGVAGVIVSPVLLILIKALYDQGYISKWIRKPEGEYGTEEPVSEGILDTDAAVQSKGDSNE